MKKIKSLHLGKEKIDVFFNNFHYFQPNTHTCGDCHVRAICAVTDLPWLSVFDALYAKARISQSPLGSTESISDLLSDFGFSWVPVSPKKGQSRPTVSQFAAQHPNDLYVLRVSHHVVGGKLGEYFDIWDCGDKSLYGYWIKPA